VILVTWSQMPEALRQHLDERLSDRGITVDDLKKLQFWVASRPDVPDDHWYKDFGSFILCGTAEFPKTFLRPSQTPWGTPL
jgi:hypothetical protein